MSRKIPTQTTVPDFLIAVIHLCRDHPLVWLGMLLLFAVLLGLAFLTGKHAAKEREL